MTSPRVGRIVPAPHGPGWRNWQTRMVQVHVPQGIGGSIPPPGTNPDRPKKAGFLALAAVSLAVSLVSLVVVALVWYLFRRLEL